MQKVSLFLRPFGEAKQIPLFESNVQPQKTAMSLHSASENVHYKGFSVVKKVEDADFVVIPHSVRKLSPAYRTHVQETIAWAGQYGKKVITFIGGDLSHRIHIAQAIVFKASVYAHEKREGEVVAVANTRDLSHESPLTWRHKSSRPVVGFCGYAGFPYISTRLKYVVKNAALDLASTMLQRPHLRAHKRGIYFRRKVLSLLKNDPRIESNFVVRTAFFHQAGDDPQRLRREYLDNVLHSDFVLCPKGDGNYSLRFFEVLSLGRIPLLIDTDMRLPLEPIVKYEQFILRVPHTELSRVPQKVIDFYQSLSDDEFVAMQKRARSMYEEYLRSDSYYRHAFSILKERGPEAL